MNERREIECMFVYGIAKRRGGKAGYCGIRTKPPKFMQGGVKRRSRGGDGRSAVTARRSACATGTARDRGIRTKPSKFKHGGAHAAGVRAPRGPSIRRKPLKIRLGGGRVGLIEAAKLEFQSTAAGARFVAADFGGGADMGHERNLCIFVHDFRNVSGRIGEGGGGAVDHGECGFEADGRGGGGIGKQGADGIVGSDGEGFGLLAQEQGLFVLGAVQGLAECGQAKPIGNCVAMDTGGFGGGTSGGAGGDQRQHL